MSDKELKDKQGEVEVKTAEAIADLRTRLTAEEKRNEKLGKDREKESADFKAYQENVKKELDEKDAELKKVEEAVKANFRPEMSSEEKEKKEYKDFNAELKSFGVMMGKSVGLEVPSGFTIEEKTALAIGNNVRAGYLQAPEVLLNEILNQDIHEFSPMRQLASVMTLSGASNTVEIPAKTARGVASWVAELGTSSEDTTLTYGLEEIKLHKSMAYFKATMEMLSDAQFNLLSELTGEYREGFDVLEGTSYITGSGVGKPEGIMTNSSVSSTNSGNASAWTYDGFIDLFFAQKEAYTMNSNWIMKRASLAEVAKLKDGDGRYLLFLPQNSPRFQILGVDIYESPDMPTIAANSYSAILGDFKKGYKIIDKLTRNIIVDPYTSKTTGVVEYTMEKRTGGKVIIPESMRKLKTSA